MRKSVGVECVQSRHQIAMKSLLALQACRLEHNTPGEAEGADGAVSDGGSEGSGSVSTPTLSTEAAESSSEAVRVERVKSDLYDGVELSFADVTRLLAASSATLDGARDAYVLQSDDNLSSPQLSREPKAAVPVIATPTLAGPPKGSIVSPPDLLPPVTESNF